jgi:DNA-binding response OmpR family regulator
MNPTIMVVEDEPATLELLRINLADAGYDVHAAPMPSRHSGC